MSTEAVPLGYGPMKIGLYILIASDAHHYDEWPKINVHIQL